MSISLFSNLQRQVLLPLIASCSPRIKILLVTVTLSSLWVPVATAACGSSAQRLPPSVSSALQLPPPLQEPASDGVAAEEPDHRRGPLMTGLWKTVFVSGGAVVNLGFNTWHSDGTEWSLDGSFPQTAGNVCPGVWERVGHRTYVTCIRHSTMRSWASRQLSFRGRQADNYPLRENKAKASSIEFC
jgi:hypothetical protein